MEVKLASVHSQNGEERSIKYFFGVKFLNKSGEWFAELSPTEAKEMEKVGRVEIVNEAEKKKINRKKAEEIKQDKADKTIKEANK